MQDISQFMSGTLYCLEQVWGFATPGAEEAGGATGLDDGEKSAEEDEPWSVCRSAEVISPRRRHESDHDRFQALE